MFSKLESLGGKHRSYDLSMMVIIILSSLVVNGGLEMPNYGGIKVLKPINTCLFFS
jgi:hypothetical protein